MLMHAYKLSRLDNRAITADLVWKSMVAWRTEAEAYASELCRRSLDIFSILKTRSEQKEEIPTSHPAPAGR